MYLVERYTLNHSRIKEQTKQRAFNNILESLECIPYTITTDDGSEYKGEFKKVLEKNKINQRIKEVDYHRSLGVIDRFSRTIKTILSKMFTELDSVNWIDYLDNMTTAYNNRPHNGVCGMSPNEAQKYKEDTIRCHLEKIKNITLYDFKVGVYCKKEIK